MLLGFFGLGILAFQVRERDVQRFVPQADSDGVHRDAFLVQRIGVGLAEAVKLCALNASLLGDRLQLAQEVSVGFSFSIWKYQVVSLSVPLPHSVLDFPNELCRNRNESVLGRFLLALPLETELAPRLRLNMQCAFLPIEVC